jgi:hypothetical protein
MKVIVTTSNLYTHLLPVFFKLYNRYWGDPFDLVGYKKPDMELPENCTWVSLGEQRGPKFFSDDLRPYFEQQPERFVWIFEDTFLKEFDRTAFEDAYRWYIQNTCGKFCLTNESMRRKHHLYLDGKLFEVAQNENYRLSTQPAIWNRDYLLQYFKPDMTPWQFETQPQQNDGWAIWGFAKNIVNHNEGVTKKDIFKIDWTGIDEDVKQEYEIQHRGR